MSTKAKPLLSYEILHEYFNYNPETGILTWKKESNSRAKVGYIAGCPVNSSGHLVVGLKGQQMLVHRIIWKMMLNEEPPVEIDHYDCNGSNNKWDNLRASNRHTNNCNRRIPGNNTSGVKGVCWIEKRQQWRARVVNNWKTVYEGFFTTIEEATEARLKHCELTRPIEFVREGKDAEL